MSPEDRLKGLATIGDKLMDDMGAVITDPVVFAYLQEHSPTLLSSLKEYREAWDNMIGDLQRGDHIDVPSGPTDFMEEFGGSYGGTDAD